MSDHSNPNLHRGDGVSGRGLLIAFGVIVAVVAILALIGAGGPPADGSATQDAITPATDSVAPATDGVAVPTE